MQLEVTSIDSAFYSYDREVDTAEFFKDKNIIGRMFDTEDEMHTAITKLEQEYALDIESFSFMEHTTEEEDQAEWDATVSAAYDEAESTGQSVDHIMGEILGGVRAEYCY